MGKGPPSTPKIHRGRAGGTEDVQGGRRTSSIPVLNPLPTEMQLQAGPAIQRPMQRIKP